MHTGLWSVFTQDALVFWQSRFLKGGWWYRDRIGFYHSHEKVSANAVDANFVVSDFYGLLIRALIGGCLGHLSPASRLWRDRLSPAKL
jgi:hypothetical protein